MNFSPFAPNLYEAYHLDCDDDCSALGILLSGKDATLEAMGQSATHEQRRALQTAFAIMSSTTKRGLYDKAVETGRQVTWQELDYLANFGTWPDPVISPPVPDYGVQPQVGQQGPRHAAPEAKHQEPTFGVNPFLAAHTPPAASPYATPFNPLQQPNYSANVPAMADNKDVSAYQGGPAERASQDKRVIMALGDFFLCTSINVMLVGAMGAMGFLLGWVLVTVFYVVGTEAIWGASPFKKIFGYEVRNRKTGEKLTAAESAKRQWFKLVNMVPGFGNVIAIFAAAISTESVKAKNSLLAKHDDLVDAEVVKKRQ